MPFRTIQRTNDTGGLDRARVREAVIRLRERKRAAAAHSSYAVRPATGVLVARERPLVPYGQPLRDAEEGEGR
jgi:hypothetical protein